MVGWRERAGAACGRPESRQVATRRACVAAGLLVRGLIGGVDVTDFPFTIGRIQGNGLVVAEEGISRRHALIDLVDGRYLIEDLNSTDGILVNGRGRMTAILRSGDVISIGPVKLVFHLTSDADATPPAPGAGGNHADRSVRDEVTERRVV